MLLKANYTLGTILRGLHLFHQGYEYPGLIEEKRTVKMNKNERQRQSQF